MSLKKGTLSWYMVTAIGVSIVIAGQFSGWNFGLEYGWSNMCIAFAIMFLFYLGFSQCISEMAATWPNAGGLSSFVRRAFGNLAGSFSGITIGLALISCAGVVATFIVGYAASLFTMNESLIKLILFIFVVAISARGAKDLVSITLIVGAIAVATLFAFSGGVASSFNVDNLEISNIPISLVGIAAAIPFALWMFVGIEHTVSCSEETKNPARDIPKGLILGLLILASTAICLLLAAPGAVGTSQLINVLDPLLAGIGAQQVVLKNIVTFGVLLGLLAGFFSIVYSASRQLFDVAREGVIPSVIAKVNKNGTPIYSVLFVAIAGFGISLLDPERVMLGVVVMFTFTYVLTSAAFIYLRRSHAHVERTYKAVGGVYLGYVMLIASALLFVTAFKFDLVVLGPFLILMVCIGSQYFSKMISVKKTHTLVK